MKIPLWVRALSPLASSIYRPEAGFLVPAAGRRRFSWACANAVE
jgi:hypothetical protein